MLHMTFPHLSSRSRARSLKHTRACTRTDAPDAGNRRQEQRTEEEQGQEQEQEQEDETPGAPCCALRRLVLLRLVLLSLSLVVLSLSLVLLSLSSTSVALCYIFSQPVQFLSSTSPVSLAN